jgi:hypothetical protein
MAWRAVRHMLMPLALGILIGPAQSAVRVCPSFVEDSGEGRTEKEAKAEALDGWMKKAEALGIKGARWQLAAGRTLQCEAWGGHYRCFARARPCTIKQVAPSNWRPQYPRDRRP